jgi:ABC-type nitrate/sulfonate/bicarbonate transport system substrate-binding protein
MTATGSAAPPARVTLNVFPGGFNWPVWVAQDLGLFARYGVAVDLETTPGSVAQWTSLADGRAQLAITLADNVVAYREGQGEADVVVDDAVALMTLDTRAMPTLVTRPDVRSYADLRGGTLSVDAVMTGYALVLVSMLEHGGLSPADYRLERVGGVAQRFTAMQRQVHAGSLFNSPLEGLLIHEGFNPLDTARSIAPRYQGQVVTARRGWAASHRDTAVSVLRALHEAVAWLYDPAHRAEGFAVYARHMPDAPPDAPATAHAVLFDAATGIPRDGAIDLDGLAAVLAMRARHGRPARPLSDPATYTDPSFLAQAIAASAG